ncbi:MAG: tetratricopeptide repeat protein [Cyanobacteria bacterium P01_E01_bin.6]
MIQSLASQSIRQEISGVRASEVSASCVLQGQFLQQQGRLSEAVACYRRAIAHDSQQADVYFQLGTACDQQGDVSSAIPCYRHAIQQDPEHVNAYSNLGCALLKQGDAQSALHVFQEAIAHHPDHAFLYNNLARAQEQQGQMDEAIASYEHAIQLQPDLVQSHFNLGALWKQLGQTDKAIICLRYVVSLNPSHVEAQSLLGQWLLSQGQIAPALACWRHVLQCHPERITDYCDRALLRSRQRSPDDSLDHLTFRCAHFLRTLWNDVHTPDLPQQLAHLYGCLGKITLDYGELNQAEAHLRKALHLHPKSLDIWLRLGQCLMQQGRLDAAIAIYHLALRYYPEQACLHQHIGRLLEVQNRPQQAIAAYRTALNLAPTPASFPSLTPPQCLKTQSVSPIRQAPCLPTHLYPSTLDWAIHTSQPGVNYTALSDPSSQANSALPAHCLLPQSPDSSCGGVTCRSCMATLLLAFEPIQVCTDVFTCTQDTSIDVTPSSTFVVTIPQGRAWVAPQENAWVICNSIGIITPENALLSDLSRDYPWYLPGCDRHHPKHHQIFRRDTLPPVERIHGRVAILSGLSGHVYYHWMMDVLPRFEILRRRGIDWDDIDYFVVNSVDRPFQQETLTTLGIPLHKIIVSDRHPHIQAEQLIVPSFPGHFDWVPPNTLQFLRDTFLPLTTDEPSAFKPVNAPESGQLNYPGFKSAPAEESKNLSFSSDTLYPERLYISRAHARYRHVINEADVMNQLQPLGFIPVVLESLSVQQQVALFAHARIIVAPHGAGLTNLAFCQPGAQVVELVSPHYMRTDYWIISHHLRLRHYVIRGKPFNCDPLRQLMYQSPLAEDIHVPIAALQAIIHQLNWA